MKRYIFLLAISVLAFASCTKEENTPKVEEKSGIALDVICSTLTPSTKAGISGVKPGEDAYDENIIKTIDYYFYPDGQTDQNSVLHGRVSVSALNQYTVNVSIDEAMLNTILFPRPVNTCQVAVLVNYPGEHPSANTKMVDIQNLPLVLQLTSDGKGKDQTEFVMYGVQEVELISRKATLIANPVVDVHRVACKITLDAYVTPSTIAPVKLIDGGVEYTLKQEWQPMIDQMYIYLENGVSNAFVSGDPEAAKPYNHFKYSQREFTGEMATHQIVRDQYSDDDPPVLIGTTTVTEQFHKSYPFYTYPQTWATSDPKEPFLKLVLPWTRIAGDDHETNPDWATKPHTWGSIQKQFYYRIMLPHDASGFVSNNWYHINLDVAILGSDIDDASVDIEGTYYVVDWGSADPVEADIKGSRYLSVSQLSHTMYNTTQLKIPYVTSNKCSITNLSVRQYNFVSSSYTNYTSQAQSGNWVTLDENNNIVINHTLNNDITSSTFDVAPYEYSFRIRHEDSEGSIYYKDITVLQYPAMYIEEHLSNGYAFVKGTGNATASETIQDNNTSLAAQYRNMGTMVQRSTVNGYGTNNNQHQYTIHVTVLPEGSTSSIGDPRSATPSTLNSGITALDNYRPTADNTSDIIAPVFRIASSYGKTAQMTFEGAQKRCAAYQENGYPAGRWRLPTQAEILYLMTLSNMNKIPTLFDPEPDAGYWSGDKWFMIRNNSGNLEFVNANGATPNNRQYTINGSNYYVWARCVYDEWYWGSEQVEPLTTWGGYKD
ncbi:MAG: hypothetical protein J6X91_04990 [Bacteroidales bacterium]|nr:hypothetical protein [Bacteroidales bacterium]